MTTKSATKTTETQDKEPQSKTSRAKTPRSKTTAKPETAMSFKQVPSYQFPCVRGIQAGAEYYTTMIPLRLLSKLFVLESDEMPAEMRAQRKLNVTRARKLKDYVLTSKNYTLSSVTVTIDVPNGQIDQFNFLEVQGDVGTLNVPMDSHFLIADGQHRIAGLKLALVENPELGDETISCVVFLHSGLQRAQTMFHDLNYYASKPNKSLNLLYDHGSDESDLARQVMKGVPVFAQYTDTELTSLNAKSSKVFTFNAIDEANKYLFTNSQLSQNEKVEKAIVFWKAITTEIPEWERLLDKEYAPSDVRQNFLCGHAIALCGLAHLGFYLLRQDNWEAKLQRIGLRSVDWSKNNPDFENRIIFGGRIHKNRTTVTALGEWLWRRCFLAEETAEGHILDWMREHFKGWDVSDIEQALADAPDSNTTAKECSTALEMHCEVSMFNIAWSHASATLKKERS
jgi:DNA sulfur modification protein DndB